MENKPSTGTNDRLIAYPDGFGRSGLQGGEEAATDGRDDAAEDRRRKVVADFLGWAVASVVFRDGSDALRTREQNDRTY